MSYQRKISGYVLTLRALFFVVTGVIALFVLRGIYDYAIFTAVLLLPLLVISPVSIKISGHAVDIEEFTFFSLRQKHYLIDRSTVLSLTVKDELLDVDDSVLLGPGTGFGLLFLFFPSSQTIRSSQVEFTYLYQDTERTLSFKLTDQEYRLVWQALKKQDSVTEWKADEKTN